MLLRPQRLPPPGATATAAALATAATPRCQTATTTATAIVTYWILCSSKNAGAGFELFCQIATPRTGQNYQIV